ncbi:hypothetical protein AMAG_12889 [Allomyces macrogynus ATCC 38327]|uniref:Pre-rRNA-processing protein PNO1 n=1 Tax=Allomyces macrogynus (strain ATCC 38327) TaxID=578462 RepID=A0A0L0T0N2_ALLM3|nr:hypothetical protein AMAG_12889 [Allomyces macrogynus ATCC 38327]|eukprot:KNE68210.1 hypothetical protein AMAG_12889 [Allomyces macrogynus ATCC 38327]
MDPKSVTLAPVDIIAAADEAAAATSTAQDDSMDVDAKPKFAPATAQEMAPTGKQFRRVLIPPHRLTPLKKEWLQIYTPLVEHMGLQCGSTSSPSASSCGCSCAETKEPSSLQKGHDFVKAFAVGFDVTDALALLRLDDLFLDSFEIKDVKTLNGDHLSRAIGRIAGKNGKTKFTIENASRTRIVVADTKIHILGSFQNIRVAKDAVVSLILGSPPGKVYSTLRTVSARMKERF